MLADQPMPKPLIRLACRKPTSSSVWLYYRIGKLDEALPYYRKSYNVAKELAAAQPGNPVLQVNVDEGGYGGRLNSLSHRRPCTG